VGYPYNPEKAKQLLAEAGYPNGFKTKLNYCTIPMFDTQMIAVQGYLKAVGIDAELVPLQLAAYNSQVGLGPGWDNSLCQILQTAGPNILVQMQQITAPGSTRFISFARPSEFQDLLAKALQTTDEKTRTSLIQQMNKVAVDNCMVTWLWNQPAMMAKTTKVHDDLLWQTPGRYLSPKAWLSK
jgi:peptide/nickel transport system substrate-binding protein